MRPRQSRLINFLAIILLALGLSMSSASRKALAQSIPEDPGFRPQPVEMSKRLSKCVFRIDEPFQSGLVSASSKGLLDMALETMKENHVSLVILTASLKLPQVRIVVDTVSDYISAHSTGIRIDTKMTGQDSPVQQGVYLNICAGHPSSISDMTNITEPDTASFVLSGIIVKVKKAFLSVDVQDDMPFVTQTVQRVVVRLRNDADGLPLALPCSRYSTDDCTPVFLQALPKSSSEEILRQLGIDKSRFSFEELANGTYVSQRQPNSESAIVFGKTNADTFAGVCIARSSISRQQWRDVFSGSSHLLSADCRLGVASPDGLFIIVNGDLPGVTQQFVTRISTIAQSKAAFSVSRQR